MNRRIRWLGIVLVACFALLFLQLNNIQVRQGPSIATSTSQPSGRPVYPPAGRHPQLRRRRAGNVETHQGRVPLRPRLPAGHGQAVRGHHGLRVRRRHGRDRARARVRPVPHPAQLARDDARPAPHPAPDDRRREAHGLGRPPAGGGEGARRPDGLGRGDRPSDGGHSRHVREPDLQPESLLGRQVPDREQCQLRQRELRGRHQQLREAPARARRSAPQLPGRGRQGTGLDLQGRRHLRHLRPGPGPRHANLARAALHRAPRDQGPDPRELRRRVLPDGGQRPGGDPPPIV